MLGNRFCLREAQTTLNTTNSNEATERTQASIEQATRTNVSGQSVFSFGVTGVLASVWGLLRIICFGNRFELGKIKTKNTPWSLACLCMSDLSFLDRCTYYPTSLTQQGIYSTSHLNSYPYKTLLYHTVHILHNIQKNSIVTIICIYSV